MNVARALAATVLVLVAIGDAASQGPVRRLATVAALREYPSYFHLQNVLLHGEFVESGIEIVLRGGERDVPVVLKDTTTPSGLVEVRGQLIDVGRLEPNDARIAAYAQERRLDPWPRPGEELVLMVTNVTSTQPAASPSVRALALQPWRFEGQKVTVVGQFRGRNLFGDLPSAPGKSRWDFVLRSADAAVWVTDLQPRGRGFVLSVDARVDTGRWLRVSGTVALERGLVTVAGNTLAEAEPDTAPVEEEAPPPPPPAEPGDVVFSSPTEGEADVPAAGRVRVQFSRGIDPTSLTDRIRVGYLGAAPDAGQAALEFTSAYDAATRAVEIRFTRPLQPFRTVRIELLEGIRTFDGAPVRPWTLTFSVGSN
ncbi:MAG: Ig-like domain-containing protein [Acidobacteria bacterium]|nr:Ig-like domain-containing protein [Acidobacteriota bacterium]